MSMRYLGAWLQAGKFNPLAAPTPNYTYNLYSWGRNDFGQLGLNNLTDYSSPKQVGALTNWLSVSCGEQHTVSIKKIGRAHV